MPLLAIFLPLHLRVQLWLLKCLAFRVFRYCSWNIVNMEETINQYNRMLNKMTMYILLTTKQSTKHFTQYTNRATYARSECQRNIQRNQQSKSQQTATTTETSKASTSINNCVCSRLSGQCQSVEMILQIQVCESIPLHVIWVRTTLILVA